MRSSGTTTQGLGASASRGAATTMAGQVLRIGLQLASIFVLARLLTPSDYGLLAMVTAVIGLGEVFRDFGLSSAAIQAKSITRQQKDNLFWINTGVGLMLAITLFFAAGGVAALYGDPRVLAVSQALSLTFLLNGLSTQFRADINRSMHFARLAIVDIGALLVGFVIGVTMAVMGYGYWSLVGMQLGQGAVGLILSVAFARWIPHGIHRDAPMKSFLNFGAGLAGSQILGYAAKNVHTVLIGASLGAVSLGLYNRAFQLLTFPLSQLQAPASQVALPVLSKLHDDRPRYDEFLLRGQTIMLHVVAIILSISTAQALPLFFVALGPQWVEAAPLFQILAVAGFATMVNYACYWVFLSKGLTGSFFRFSLFSRPLLIAIILVGATGGLYGIAIAYSAGSLLMWPLTLLWLHRASDAPTLRMFGNGVRIIAVYSVATAASYGAAHLLPAGAYLLQIALGTVTVFATVALVALLWPRFRRDVVSVLDTARFFRRRRK
ncbi:lipopolysaccharide biosynthesis protein [Frigoribacterium faeni]|uniref:lipopolysaccharide biosynthesis protein n=1 Tax=Frigoribacterium faeni TaxID=145483 RepID=UPI0024336589|nr:lipopolysaccharide biosynthesis protein [Frigoribacterium faeni]MCJ0700457.1 lipopolysaccharide biosynthesis protein [Frigoribacterium faeni]